MDGTLLEKKYNIIGRIEALEKGSSYELPIASAETLGGVKVGEGLSIDSETGVLSATQQGGYEIKTKSLTPSSIYIGSVGTFTDSTLKNVAIVGWDVTGIDMYAFAVTSLYSDDDGLTMKIKNNANASITPSAINVKYIEGFDVPVTKARKKSSK